MRVGRGKAATRVLAAILMSTTSLASANQCATPGRDGDVVISSNSVVNTYHPGTTASAAAGSTSLAIGAGVGQTQISAGDLLLIVQVQGATIDTTNGTAYGGTQGRGVTTGNGYSTLAPAGRYEYARATNSVALTGGTVTLSAPILNTYTTGQAGTTAPRRRFMVIRVPEYRNLTLTGSLTAPAWNGSTGGIVAVDVSGTLTLNGGGVNVSALGFRGGGGYTSSGNILASNADYSSVLGTGSANASGAKGEGIAGTPIKTYAGGSVTIGSVEDVMGLRSGARGAPGNAGGGGTDGAVADSQENSGGGGGGGAGAGGRGGHAWCGRYTAGTCAQTGGIGGVGIPDNGTGSLVMGGGGGAATTNNATGPLAKGGSSSGAQGGGAILVRARSITGSGSFLADGGTFNAGVTNDGTGGGGGGGTIQIVAGSSNASITARANGGNGMSNTGGGAPHGPGGGGGGGSVVSTVSVSAIVNGGANGTTSANSSFGSAYGATAGQAGLVNTSWSASSVPGYSAGYECNPVVSKSFAASSIPTNGSTRLTVTLTNPNPTLAATNGSFNDALPTGTLVSATPAATTNCTNASLTATAGGQAFTLTGASIPAQGSCTASVNVTANQAGTFVNTIPTGGSVATWPAGTNLTTTNENAVSANASLTVTQGLSISKQAAVLYDPISGVSAQARAIPGSYVQYSLTVTNPSNAPIDANTVVLGDVLPPNISLIVAPLYQQQGYPNARGPFQYLDGVRADGSAGTASGLTFTYEGASSTTDSAEFSNDGTTYGYVPVQAANFTDPNAKALRFRMFGTMAPSSVFTVNFLVRVN